MHPFANQGTVCRHHVFCFALSQHPPMLYLRSPRSRNANCISFASKTMQVERRYRSSALYTVTAVSTLLLTLYSNTLQKKVQRGSL